WTLDESTGTTAADASGRGNTGTITGATFTASGKVGGARDFTASGSKVAVGLNGFNFTEGTIAFWYRPLYSTNNTCGVGPSMVIVGPDISPHGRIPIGNSQEFQPVRINHLSAPQDPLSATHLTANTWYHLAYTWNATAGEQKYYLNGALDPAGTGTW